MASNKNIPHKSQGANEPDKNQSVQSDAADVDWMIMSDLSTRIGGYPESKSGTNQLPANSSSQVSSNQSSENDVEDIEWLRSLGLDDAIVRSPSSQNTSNSYGNNATNNDEVGNIDWLIVTDLNARMDDSGMKVKTEPSYQNIGQAQTILQSDNIMDSLDDDLGLDGLDFLEGSDFSDLDSLGFDASNSFNMDEVQNEIESTEVKIDGLAELLDDRDDSSFDLSNNGNDNDWDIISEVLDENPIQSSSDRILDTVNNPYEVDSLELDTDDDLIFTEEVSSLEITFDDETDNTFEIVPPLDSLDSNVTENEMWSSNSSNLEPEIIDESVDNAFISDWGQISENAIDDAVWDSAPSIDPNLMTSTSIDNAFGELGGWENASNVEQSELGGHSDFDFSNNVDPFASGVGLESEQFLEQPFDDFNDTSLVNLDNSEQIPDQQQFTNFNELGDQLGDQLDDDIAASLEANEFDSSENIPSDSDWKSLGESIGDQVADSSFDNYTDDFAADQLTDSGLGEDFDNSIVPPPVNTVLGTSNWNTNSPESFVAGGNADGILEGLLNEDFDLASFDEDSLLEVPASTFNSANISTTLTPSRASSSEDIDAGQTYNLPSINAVDGLHNISSQNDSFDEALGNDLINDNYGEIDFQQEALAHDLLNDLVSESDDFGLANNSPIISSPNIPSPNVNLASSQNFILDSSDSDFLDEFDLDVIDPLIGESFNTGFGSKPISTGLTPPIAPITPISPITSIPPIAPPPPSLPPLKKQEPTSPSSNYLPLPPSLPPLPPKRVPTHGRPNPTPPSFPAVNAGSQSQPQNRIGNRNKEKDFDRFHSQSDQQKNRKPMASIDAAWSDLLDADTVLSGGQPSSGSSYSDISNTMPPMAGASTGKASQGRENRERNSSGMPKRKDTSLHDFNELGLETHDNDTDWSGLLDSGDLSDSITTISPQVNQRPSRARTNPTASRSDSTSVSETKEIPRDRRKPAPSFGDSTQARMGATPDQIDFNRFTEDSYEDHIHSVEKSPAATPSKPKLTLPTISLESLWSKYLKIPVIGLTSLGGVFLLYSLLNRPVFDLGLRWGLFKDASGKDFTNADFKGAKLDNVDFSKAILTGAKMQDASLVGANFQGANIDGVNFTKANLNRARLIQASVIWAEFNSAQMNLVDFAGADLTRSNFAGAKMEGANLKGSKIGAQGTEKATKFSATTLLAWQIVNEPRQGRNLSNQDLSGLNLSFTSLKRANLSNVKLNYTDMTNTDLSGANLSGGQVNGANWSGAKLNGVNLTGVDFDKNKLPKTDEETVCPNGKKGPCKF